MQPGMAEAHFADRRAAFRAKEPQRGDVGAIEMSTIPNPYTAQDAAFLRNLTLPQDDRNDITVQEYRGCIGISCASSIGLFAYLVEQIGSGIGKVGVARLLRTAKVVPVPSEAGVMVFWRDLPWLDTGASTNEATSTTQDDSTERKSQDARRD